MKKVIFSLKKNKTIFSVPLLFCFITIFFLSSMLHAQIRGSRYAYLSASSTKKLSIYKLNNNYYSLCDGWGIGRLDGSHASGSTEDICRKAFYFPTTEIPIGSTIYQVQFTVSFDNPHNHSGFATLGVFDDPGNYCESIFLACAGSFVCDEVIDYISPSNPYIGNGNAVNTMQSAVNYRTNYNIGAKASNEGINNVTLDIGVEIFVIYFPPTYSTTIKTSFNGGSISIDGTPCNPGLGAQRVWYRNSQHTLVAPAEQEWGSYFYIFSYWEDKDGNKDYNTNKTITIDDDNIWTAVYSQNCRLIVQNDFGGGTVSIDGVPMNSPATKIVDVGSFHYFGTIDKQLIDDYKRIFKKWSDNTTYADHPSIQINSSTTFTASTRRECNIIIQNSFVSAGNGGVIEVNGNQYNSPTAAFLV